MIQKGTENSLLSLQKWGGKMEKALLIALSGLRKTKRQTAAIAVLIFLASLMLNIWLMLSMDYKQNFDRYHEKLNEGHVILATIGNRAGIWDFLEQTIENNKHTTDSSVENFFLEKVKYANCSFAYNGGEIMNAAVFLDKQAALSRPVGKIEIVEDSNIKSGIYMPMLYKSDDIAVGKTITITIGKNKITYTICGFTNSIMTGSHNCAICSFILTEDKYKELETESYIQDSILCSVRLKDKTDSEDYESTLNNAVSSRYPDIEIISNSYALVYQSRYISQMICSGIISAMAFIILLIALVVIVSNITNYIQTEMQNLGALKATGYTGRQLIYPLLLQFVGITLAASIAGVVISYCLFPFINTMMVSQTGIPYKIHFLPAPILITLAFLCVSVITTVWLPARRIKKIEPVVALRQGVLTHNFKHNHIPLENADIPLNLALALKTTLSGIKHNVTICITMFVLSLILVFSGTMLENIIIDQEPFIRLIVGETADSCINIKSDSEKDFLETMAADKRVKKVYLYNSLNVSHAEGTELMATICDDFSKVNNKSVVFEGRFPEFDNEIAIAAKYARENNLECGEEITITSDGKEATYIISGFTQISNNLGKDCLITRDGYERLSVLQNTSYYLDLADGTGIDSFNQEVTKKFGNNVNATINIKSVINGSASVYVSLMTIIVISVLILSVLIIAFVIYLLVRTMLNNKKRDYGIMKALGFTTGQLVIQTAASFMPAAILSTTAGLIINSLLINPLGALFLSGIGIVKCTFTVPVWFTIAAGAGLILSAFIIACLLSLKIRKITPRTLLTGE